MASELRLLQRSLEDARKSLSNTDSRIHKLTGRKPIDARETPRGRLPSGGDIRPLPRARTRSWNQSSVETAAKRRDTVGSLSRFAGRLEDREEGETVSSDEETQKPSLSSVVAGGSVARTPMRSSRTSTDSVPEDKKGKARNKRMLGMLLGTLQKFRVDQQKQADTGKDQKRQEIEARVEEERLASREKAAIERRELFLQRKSQQREVMQLQQKMELASAFEEWEQHYGLLGSYIKTQTTPQIFYLPRAHNKATSKLLESTKAEIAGHLEKMQQELKDLIDDQEPPVLTSPAPTANSKTLNQSMDDDDSKDHDLGELEGQPAELNITAQHEEEASVQQQQQQEQQGDGSGLGSGVTEGEKGEGGGVDEVSDSVSNRVAVGVGEGDETPEAGASTPTGSNKMDSD